ncbi:protein kinase domain containing protein [Nitzschia inconspicua]|uniref:Protein kinase domain containing protein n=1 Tax=Nitzschia inconspicua TaxID=303405 RepID=A0A9K3M6D6_9STRA|nr:protein kinase domain containing protein [Nitzschia inconspicua]
MGACQSSSAAVDSASKSLQTVGTGRTVNCMGGGSSGSDIDSHTPQPQAHKSVTHRVEAIPTKEIPSSILQTEALKDHDIERKSDQLKDRPGYSSGGSSFIESSDEENTAIRTNSTRHDKLCEWKQELASNGDWTAKMVRIETDFGRDIEDVYEGVHDGVILGEGVAGVVRKVKHKETGIYFAVKVLNLGLLVCDAVLDSLREEIFIMCQLDHPNILRLEEVYESETQIFLIQELCEGGDLFDRLDEKPEDQPYHYSEVQCAKLVKQMLSAVRYLHSRKIVHRDLKLENFLFENKESDDLKMIDFGLSKHFKSDEAVLHDAVGTPYTVAPEIIRGSYNSKADIWSIGVITYLLLSGESPFGGIYDSDKMECVRDNILHCRLPFEPKELWDEVSCEAKRFVRRLLTDNPTCRPTAREAQQDEWLQKFSNMDVEGSKALSPDLVGNLLKFKDYSDMHRVLLDVLSFALLPEQIHKLKSEFQKMNPDGDGEITLEELKEVLLNRAGAGSLGSLQEEEVVDIFNALRIKDSETTIRWHEFIAAGLSKSDFDDRNLKLAFDRLDYDRKGYITHSNMCEMLCTSDGKMDETVLKMWHDGLKEIRCKANDKITFEEFKRFLKGQVPKEAMLANIRSGDAVKRNSSRPLISPIFALHPVPECLATAALTLDDEKMIMGLPDALKKMPPRLMADRAISVVLPGSGSMVSDGDDDYDLPSLNGAELRVKDNSSHPDSEAYRKRQEFRLSVLHASKLFDQKRQAWNPLTYSNPAGLTMVAGARRPSLDARQDSSNLVVASKRSGRRNRNNRKKTSSDLSLLVRSIEA